MDLEAEVRTNSRDINALAITVTRLATTFEGSEKRHDSEMDVMKTALQGIEQLNARMAATVGMEKDIRAISDTLGELKGDIRTNKHETLNLKQGMQAIEILREKVVDNAKIIAAMDAKIDALEKWRERTRDRTAGAAWAAKVFWALFGTGILAVMGFVIKGIVMHQDLTRISGQ